MFSSLDEGLMLHAAPGVYVAGEMLDWEAPTGGYLLQGAFASGVAAARAVIASLSGALGDHGWRGASSAARGAPSPVA